MRVLVVDDDEISRELVAYTLTDAGYEVETARNGREALELLRMGRHRVVVSDWEMPEMTGVELCRRIRTRHSGGYTYVVLVTSRQRPEDIVEGLEAGADDFVGKPFQPAELRLRVRAGERLLSLESRNVTIFALAKLADSRDPETGTHLERMREYSRVLAQHLSQQPKFRDVIDADFVDAIYQTSPLHDIGKVGIPDDILRKPGRLTPEEFEVMKRHALIGADTLEEALQRYPEAGFLHMARDIALTHHERYDGGGYPHGLAGEQIPLSGRIVALADVYDALTSRRVYKPPFPHEKARAIILEERGTHFDPDVVDAFMASEGMFVAIRQGFEDESEAGEFAGTPEALVSVP